MIVGVVGCGGFGREIMPIISQSSAIPPGTRRVFLEEGIPQSRSVNGYEVLSISNFLTLEDTQKLFTVAIADSRVRQRIASAMTAYSCAAISVQSDQAVVYDSCSIGEGAILCSGSIITSNASVGSFFHLNLQSYVAHDVVIGDFVTFAPRVACNGNVKIDDHAYIGTGACLRPGVRIGRAAIVGMGAVVLNDIPAGETWVGNPARPLRR